MVHRITATAIGTLLVVALIVGAVAGTLYFSYQQSKLRAQSQLSEALHAHGQLLLQLADFATELARRPSPPPDDADLPLVAAQSVLREFPTSVEFSVGRLEAGRPVLLLRAYNGQIAARHVRLGGKDSRVPFMRRALEGRTGADAGQDDSGREVLGAYRWIPELGLGLTAKIPLDEIRLPYVQAVLVNSIAWVFVVLLIMLGFRIAVVPIRRRLNLRESQYRAMFDSALDGIIIADRTGTIRAANPAAQTLLGYRQRELIGRSVSRLCAPEGRRGSGIDATALLALADGDSLDAKHEVTVRRKDGSTFPCSLRVSRLTVEGQHLVMGTLRDISDQKLTARALLEAKEAAESATRAKSQFLANMSHEIRSPMTGVSGMLELLRATPLDDAQLQYVELAQESASALLSVINDILDLSKIESGNLTLEQTVFDATELVTHVAGLFRPRAERKGIALHVDIEPETARPVVGDPLRLRQVLVNLVDNAIKFTSEGGVTLRLKSETAEPAPPGLQFVVSDTGCGIGEEQQDNLFKPFMQADLSTARLHGGTGLGLSISRRIIELMGGDIDFRSEAGRGTDFRVTLRLPQADAGSLPDDGGSRQNAVVSREEPATDRLDELHARVLVVDDREINRILCREMLNTLGIEAVTASSGQEALRQLEESPFDLVLMDCEMPGMDGYAAARRIRDREQAEGLPRIPIVALTAHAMTGARDDCLAAGMDDHLAKPFRVSQLRALLHTWLAENPATA